MPECNERKEEPAMRWMAVLLAFLSLFVSGAAEELYPALHDPLDREVQALAIMSQRDEAFEGVEYNGGLLTIRGCLPVSMTNSVIAALGVTDRETAIGMVKETAELLVFPRARKKGRVELQYLPSLLNPQERAKEGETFPHMAKTVGRYPGEIRFMNGEMDAQRACEQLQEMDVPCMLVGRMTLQEGWTEMIRLIGQLDAMGYPDARILIAHAGAGTESSGAPLRSGDSGHYLTLMIHAGSFLEEGRVYVLDSLPRAIKGEESGYTMVLRRPYPFWQEYTAFRKVFDAGRISPTVIRLSLFDRAAWTAGDADQKAKQFSDLIVFGPCVVTIVLE